VSRPVTVVTDDEGSGEARAVVMALEAALFTVKVADGERLPADELLVLLDNALLPNALFALISQMPGRAVFPNVVLVVENAEASGGLLAEGFRDVVERRDVVAALQAILTGRPPVYMQRLRELIERKFLSGFSDELHGRAQCGTTAPRLRRPRARLSNVGKQTPLAAQAIVPTLRRRFSRRPRLE